MQGFFCQNGSPSWCKICAHLVFFWSKLVQNLLMLPQQRSREGKWLKVGLKNIAFLGKTVLKLVQNLCSPGAKGSFFLQNCARSCCQERRAGGGCMWRMWVDVEWRGGGTRLVKDKKQYHSSHLCRPFWGFTSGVFLNWIIRPFNTKPFSNFELLLGRRPTQYITQL